MERLFQPVLGGAFTDLGTRIVAAIGDDRPAVILAGLGLVDLVAAARAVFDSIELAILGVEGDALRVAVTFRPDFRQRLAPSLNGLSAGMLPSVLMWMIEPASSCQFCERSRLPRSPTLMNSVPSEAIAMREPYWILPEVKRRMLKIGLTASSVFSSVESAALKASVPEPWLLAMAAVK